VLKLAKKAYHAVALLALLHLAGLVGVLGYLVTTDRITAEHARAAAKALRGELDEAEVEADSEPAGEDTAETIPETAAEGAAREEIGRRNIERLKTQADQQLLLARRAMVDVTRRREDFERQQEELARQREQADSERLREGFKKDVEWLSAESPKTALAHLLIRPTEDAARLLLEMDTRRGAKVIAAAQKDPRKWAQFLPILQKARQLTPAVEGGEEQAQPGATQG